MKENKEFLKKSYSVCRYVFLYLFVTGVISVIVYGMSGYFIPFLSGFSTNSLLAAEELQKQAVIAGELTSEESVYLIFVAIYVSILELVPYLLVFIFSKKTFGWMKAGLIIYAVDTFTAVMLLISYCGDNSASLPFFIFLVILHLVALGVVIYGFNAGRAVFPKRAYGYRGNYQYYGNGAFATVRTLCLIYDTNAYENADFTYYINGSQQGMLSFGQTRIILLDGNYQRIVVSAPGCVSCETVVPAGTNDVTYTVRVVFNNNNGEKVVSVSPLAD